MREVVERIPAQQSFDGEPARRLVVGDDRVGIFRRRGQSDARDRVSDRRDIVRQTSGLQFVTEPADDRAVLQSPQQALPVPTQLLRLSVAARQRTLHAAAPQESQELVVAVLAEHEVIPVRGVVQRHALVDARVAELTLQRVLRRLETAEPPFLGCFVQIPMA